ncbi:MAG: hypothetical protein HUU20_19330 [Pirellulales bacterium]|nr:hypothetical protein [Pirellulales bacterium]
MRRVLGLLWGFGTSVASPGRPTKADRPEHQAARLRGVLEKWIEESNDQGRIAEPAEVAAAKGATKAGNRPQGGTKAKDKKAERTSK